MNQVTPPSSTMPALQTGDVIACWGTDRVSRVISLMTSSILPPWELCWSPSHVAIIHEHAETGPRWYESTTLVEGQRGAQCHGPDERWLAYGGRCVVFRPTIEVDDGQQARMGAELRRMVSQGVPYDLSGAVISGTRFVRYLAPASGDRLFCSELVARALQVSRLMNWSSPSSYSPGRLLRELVKTGTYERLSNATRS